ncbi:hypothetical protein COU18_00185 [Candidatus Kaiserbacteria bacterium CG10_big_fil_rev_8_21_14_0_10_51_14]|uniref:DNA polymerase III delta N-terminal domain-containing protein n=1 Tax=Candidatus Kaiserbacteria bacterium CG10_big_fil_rev_8_21_14_0_10_51_14 TaxID=1974610 RepID=A0A2H0UCN8_9BACT|nr:MAG: hypothetical protein COU18_00185 [Candidatus Kaiserbacteria bacterium CG10_big_fil_rev_8_21_14_0_10_51_14]
MLYLFTGTDREKTRAALNAAVQKMSSAQGGPASGGKNAQALRISDASTLADMETSLRGGGMFGESRVIVLDGVLVNEEMRTLVISSLPMMKDSEETFFILEEKPDADTRKRIEKYAEKSERYDGATKKRDSSIFDLANALARRDKKALWVTLQRELSKGAAPEALHGVLFWGAKDLLLRSKADSPEHRRGITLITELVALPHEARRRGEELEYALERFVLSGL